MGNFVIKRTSAHLNSCPITSLGAPVVSVLLRRLISVRAGECALSAAPDQSVW